LRKSSKGRRWFNGWLLFDGCLKSVDPVLSVPGNDGMRKEEDARKGKKKNVNRVINMI
jgi:hypothetical protein